MTNEELKHLIKTVQNTDMRTRRIEMYIAGDPKFKIKGLAHRIDYHEAKIEEFAKDKVRVVTIAAVFSAIFGFLSSMFHKFLN